MITAEQLKEIYPRVHNLDIYIDPLNEGMRDFEINTANRVRGFIPQILHESQGFLYMKELGDGKEYEGRKDLGNTQIGDGAKYKGRGPLEITGRDNYRLCGLALGLDLLSKPELLEDPRYGFKASAWWWNNKGLNGICDHPENWTIQVKSKSYPLGRIFTKIEWLSYRVNGGFNGINERIDLYNKALTVIK